MESPVSKTKKLVTQLAIVYSNVSEEEKNEIDNYIDKIDQELQLDEGQYLLKPEEICLCQQELGRIVFRGEIFCCSCLKLVPSTEEK